MFGIGLHPRAMSMFAALPKSWFVLLSMVPVTIIDNEDRVAER